MLSKIVFCINDRISVDKQMQAQAKAVIAYLNECGIAGELHHVTDGSRLICDDPGQTLFLADDEIVAQTLQEKGYYVIAWQADSDLNRKFGGVKYIFTNIDEVDLDSYVKVYQRLAGISWTILETERCLVRETRVEDVDDFYKIYADPAMTRYMEGLFENPEDERRYTRDYIEKVYGFMGFGVWTVIEKSTGEIIGRAGFSIRNGFDEVELGFLIGVPWQGKGYAMEACRKIMEYGRTVLQFGTVQTLVKKENEISIHICEKLGFRAYDEVNIEENIYGESYQNGHSVSFSPSHYGKYIRLIWEADKRG